MIKTTIISTIFVTFIILITIISVNNFKMRVELPHNMKKAFFDGCMDAKMQHKDNLDVPLEEEIRCFDESDKYGSMIKDQMKDE